MYEREIETAIRAVKGAAERALRIQSEGLKPEYKADESPVTAADKASEAFIAATLEEAFPMDGLLGEEGSNRPARSGRRWIVDPIDGTRDFIRGNQLWAILLGLEDQDRVVAGAVYLPVLDRLFWAARGEGAYEGDRRLHVSSISTVAESVICFNNLVGAAKEEYAERVVPWIGNFWSSRALGGALDAMMLSAGQVEVWVEPKVAPWDLAGPSIILEEAGACFFDLKGRNSIYGGSAAACVPALEGEVKRFLQLA